MENQNDRPPLTTITTSGVYRLRLTAPKLDRIKSYEDGTCSAKLFFIDEQGNCFSKSYGTKYPGSLALLVGRLSGTYAKEIRADATPAEFQQYVSPAVGKPADISVEVTPNGEWNGKPQYKYKLTFAKGSQKPTAPAPKADTDEGVPF